MGKHTVISTRLEDKQILALDALATASERSRAAIVKEAIDAHLKRSADFLAFVQEGADAIAHGDVHDQDAVEQWLEERLALRRQQTHSNG